MSHETALVRGDHEAGNRSSRFATTAPLMHCARAYRYTHSVRDHHYETTRVASVPLAAIRWRPRGEDGEMAGAGGVRAHAAREHTNEQRNTQQQFGSLALLWRSPHTHRMSVMTGWQACPCARTRHAHRGSEMPRLAHSATKDQPPCQSNHPHPQPPHCCCRSLMRLLPVPSPAMRRHRMRRSWPPAPLMSESSIPLLREAP